MSGKDLLIISILTLFTVLSWIIYDVYHAATTSTIPKVQQEKMTPLDPKFDTDTILKVIENKN